MKPVWPHLWGACLLAVAAGCAPRVGESGTPVKVPAIASQPVRVVLTLDANQMPEAAAWLEALQAYSNTPVHYLRSLTPTTHLYVFGVAAQTSISDWLARLRRAPGVRDAELDARATSQ
jgi:hypothetical protein